MGAVGGIGAGGGAGGRFRSAVSSSFDSSRVCVSVASSVGIGVFLIAGYVAKHVAGPATIVSIAIAALVAVMAGYYYMCDLGLGWVGCGAVRCDKMRRRRE